MTRLAFHPTPDQLPALTGDLASPDLSLREIAERHNTTLDALTLYLTSDRSLEHIATLELAAAVRTRLAASLHLNRAVAALSDMLDDYTHARAEARAPSPVAAANTASPTPFPAASSSPPPSLILQERQRQNARRACSLLFRLATFTPRPLAGVASPATPRLSVTNSTASSPAQSPTAAPAQAESPSVPCRAASAASPPRQEADRAPSPPASPTAAIPRASRQSLTAYSTARPCTPAPTPALCETG